jgi:CheY-like chemotaxis protein
MVQSKTFRILIVDDATINRKLLRKMLEKLRHICDEAENGKVAVDLFTKAVESNRKYDTILMDNEMPVMNGPDSVQRIRELGYDTLIVGLTGNILPEDVAYFKNHGVDTVLPKPFVLKDLEAFWMEHGLRGC